MNERGSLVTVDFHQLKFHVAKTGAVDHDAVSDPEWTGTKEPILKRLASAWSTIHDAHPAGHLSLVTNWPWDPSSPIARLLRDGGQLKDEFFTQGPRSDVGKIRERWQKTCELSDADFAAFVKALRFSTSAVSQDDAELWLQDKCQLAGLGSAKSAIRSKTALSGLPLSVVRRHSRSWLPVIAIDATCDHRPVAHGTDHSPYDDLGARFIESGRTEHTPESLRAIVEEQGLVLEKESPYRTTFAVRSFTRFAHVPETDGACVVDLTDMFDGRTPSDANAWHGPIRDRLDGSLVQVEGLAQPVYVALDAHLSIAWYVGYMLDPKSGIPLLLRQRVKGKGIELWDVSVARRPDNAKQWELTSDEAPGDEMAIVISVTHSGLADAQRHVRESLPAVGKIVHATLPELGPRAIQDGPHARWLADEVIRLLAAETAQLRPKHVHVFAACPASLAFLVGQEARVLGPATIYEFEFGRATRAYLPGMTTASKVDQR